MKHPNISIKHWYIPAILLLALTLPCATVKAQDDYVTVQGAAVNTSVWSNNPSLTPPHWHVEPSSGSLTNQVRILAAAYMGTDPSGEPSATYYVNPASPFSSPLTVTDPPIVGSTYFFSGIQRGYPYTIIAWIDGNENFLYDKGEPCGKRVITPASDVSGLVLVIKDDSDTDGLEDWWEAHWFGNLRERSETDYDNDGLANIEEHDYIFYQILSDILPNDWDSDNDGMDDDWEIFYGMSPTNNVGAEGANGDRDGDGLRNAAEYRSVDGVGRKASGSITGKAIDTGSRDASDPNRSDSDDDGVNDNTEIFSHLTNPVHPMSSRNYKERSLMMSSGPVVLTDPVGNFFSPGVNNWTIEFWIYPQTDGNGIIYSFTNSAGGDEFQIALTNFLPEIIIIGSNENEITVGGTSESIAELPSNQWSQITVTWHPFNNSLAIWIDSVLIWDAEETFGSPDFRPGGVTILQGFTDGYFDELRIWNYQRSPSDIQYWSTRLYPSPERTYPSADTPFPPPGYLMLKTQSKTYFLSTIQNYLSYLGNSEHPLCGYYRFDDAGCGIENFAFLNVTNFYLTGPVTNGVTDTQAVTLSGSDDSDGDGIPEWWAALHNLEQYQEYYSSQYGPIWNSSAQQFEYLRSFAAYASIGNLMKWCENESDPAAVYHYSKTIPDFCIADQACFTKDIYLQVTPLQATLNLFTPGMESTAVYINGTSITSDPTDTLQEINIANYLKVGRNRIYVRCESKMENIILADKIITSASTNNNILFSYDLDSSSLPSVSTPKALGKFDASLTCDNMPIIIRGDLSRGDPRSVWHCQLWTTAYENEVGNMPMHDRELRVLPGNTEYGLPFNAERDNNPLNPDLADDYLDAYYEYISRTNPRDKDSNDNGVSDGDEDFDHDGLINRIEQVFGSDPWLPDTDDDGSFDGTDRGTDGHPAASLSPQKNLSLHFGGTDSDYITFPKNQRFAMGEWSLEAWVKPDADEANGGIIIQRLVAGTNAINYELGLGDGIIAPINYPYVKILLNTPGAIAEIAVAGSAIPATGSNWTHLAATYYSDLKLFVNGTNVASKQTTFGPAISDRGPIIQKMGAGFKGCLDELRIWNIKLEAQQILNNLTEVYSGNQNTLVAYYRFDDSTSYGTNSLGGTIGTSGNNVTNIYNSSVGTTAPWLQGQVEDYVLAYSADWLNKWAHAGSIFGNVLYSTDHAVVGPPRLQVFLEPQQAVTAGAVWSIDGGTTWKNSSYLLTQLSAGDYTLSFKDIDGWVAPSSTNVTLFRDTLTVMTNTYHNTATLTVSLNPSAVTPVAQWTINNGLTWHYSGETENNLVGGTDYYLQFSNISAIVGYEQYRAPTNIPPVVLADGETRSVSYQYSMIVGSVRTLIEPTNVVAIARWRISGSTNWNVSGTTINNLSYGDHLIEFYDVAGYITPNDDIIKVTNDNLIVYSVTYDPMPEPTSLSVNINPAGARTAGAQWQADSGSWLNSGDVQLTTPGIHTVTFKTIKDWLTPTEMSITVVTSAQTIASATYYQAATYGSSGTNPGQLRKPRGLAINQRYLYITDSDNNRIQVFDTATRRWSIIGSSGSSAGQFKQPFGITIDSNGNLWIADTGNHRIQRRSTTGTWTTWGGYGTTSEKLNGPFDIALDSNGYVYITDHYNNRVQRLSPNGQWSTFINSGAEDGKVTLPSGIFIDSSNIIYVSDYNPSTGISRIQKFDAFGSFIATVGSSTEGAGDLHKPTGIAIAGTTNLLVADTGDSQIRQTPISSLSWSELIGSSVLNGPRDIVVDAWGNQYIADTGNDRIMLLPRTDSDEDGIPNDVETATYGTNPNNADSDADGSTDRAEIYAGTNPTNALSFPPPTALDFDNDSISDLALYFAPNGAWYFMNSSVGFTTKTFGYASTVPIAGDFDGDGTKDYGCYDAAGNFGQPAGSWYIMRSTAGFTTKTFGYAGTAPVVGDFDGDGIDDYGCYDAAGNYGQPAGSWYITRSTAGFTTKTFGYAGTVPVVGDFDGDGIDDYGCYDAAGNYGQPQGSWYLMRSTAGFTTKTFGYAGTVPVVGDFDGDGIDDYGCYDAAGNYGQPAGSWYIMQSTAGFTTTTFGYAGTVPVIGDFDGNGTYDIGVYHAPDGKWYISIEPAGVYQPTFGYEGTVPVGGLTQ